VTHGCSEMSPKAPHEQVAREDHHCTSQEHEEHEHRIGQVYFDLGNGDALVVTSATAYPGRDSEMAASAPLEHFPF
jgi:hypothetical protein